jgi:hypothetical protein
VAPNGTPAAAGCDAQQLADNADATDELTVSIIPAAADVAASLFIFSTLVCFWPTEEPPFCWALECCLLLLTFDDATLLLDDAADEEGGVDEDGAIPDAVSRSDWCWCWNWWWE